MKAICAYVVAVQSSMLSVLAQGNFQNLNFEAASIPPGSQPGMTVSASSAIPGWSPSPDVVFGTPGITYDGFSGGGAFVSINDSNTGLGFTPLQGKYSIVLFGGQGVSASISQTGLVPASSQSIQMDIAFPFYGFIPSAPFVVALGSQSITMSPLKVFPNYTVRAEAN